MFKKSSAARVGLLLVMAFLALHPSPTLAQQPVVIELFTSEGCSDCPPADALLTQLSHQRNSKSTELILLEEHVDYWNSSGWFLRFYGPPEPLRKAIPPGNRLYAADGGGRAASRRWQ